MPKPKLSAISFDIDHTLIDFDECLRRALLKVSAKLLDEFAIDVGFDDLQAARDRIAANITDNVFDFLDIRQESFRVILKRYQQPEDHSDMLIELFMKERFNDIVFMPGALEMLSLLPEGLKVAALSNGNSDPEKLGFAAHFDVMLLGEGLAYKKPDQRAFQAVLDAFELSDPSALIHVGDSLETDIEGATAAGVRTIWYNMSDESATFADHKVTDLMEIVTLLSDHYDIAD